MRNSTEITRGYQIFSIFKRMMFGSFVCAIIQLVAVIAAYENNILRNIAGVIFVLIYFGMLSGQASVLGKFDNKPYTPLSYNYKWPLLWGVLLALFNIITILIFKLNWAFGAPNPIINIIFFVLQSPYFAFLLEKSGYYPFVLACVSTLLPVVACILGYIMGKNEFLIWNKIHNFMFEKGKKDA